MITTANVLIMKLAQLNVKGVEMSDKLGDKVNLNINGQIIPCESHVMHMQMYGRATRVKTKFLEILNNLKNSDYYDANLYDAKSYDKGWRDCESAIFWEVNKDSIDTPRKMLREREALMAIKSYFLGVNEISKEDLNDIKDIVLEGLKSDD